MNTSTDIWGEDAEESVPISPGLQQADRSHQIQTRTLAQPPTKLQPQFLLAFIPRRSVRMHREDNVHRGDESHARVRPTSLPLAYPRPDDVSVLRTHKFRTPSRGLIANFEFEPAYEGQVAQPTTAITMSEFAVSFRWG